MTTVPPTPVALRRFTKLVAAATLFLIFAGAMVTSTGSGLAVPDWPLSYGMLMPPMVAGIFYEHGHRMIAASVGFLTVIQAVWLQMREPKRFLRVMGWIALAAVILQGLLGGLTVIFLLPKVISIAHAGLAEIFLCINVAIAFFASRTFVALREGRSDVPAPAAATILPVLVYVQVLAGALVRHLHAGLAIPDFPLSFGKVVPAFTSPAIAANYAHRVGALVVTLGVIAAIAAVRRSPHAVVRRVGWVLGAVIAVQIFLGAEVVWSGGGNDKIYHTLGGREAMRHSMVTSLHVMTGAATLAISLLGALMTRSASSPRGPAPQAVLREEVAL